MKIKSQKAKISREGAKGIAKKNPSVFVASLPPRKKLRGRVLPALFNFLYLVPACPVGFDLSHAACPG
ncbi:MAG: hypothetical protein E2O76_05450 [Caldithrix sp.]|nr:MAG: hypothetical protein E2O76_05450 [Caldithrix sp.]